MLETLHQTRAAGIRVKGLFDDGASDEDESSLQETVDFLRTAPIDLAQVTKFTPYPGTPSYATIRDRGTFVEEWERNERHELGVRAARAHAGDPRAVLPARVPDVLQPS
jgi:hypothetical protein